MAPRHITSYPNMAPKHSAMASQYDRATAIWDCSRYQWPNFNDDCTAADVTPYKEIFTADIPGIKSQHRPELKK